jgi:hypothetical protein
MTTSRWSIKNALRQVRGARNAVARAKVRHGRNDVVTEMLERLLAQLNADEKLALEANRAAVAREVRARRAA